MKKLVGILLTLIMIFSCVEICFAQSETTDEFIKLPDTYEEIHEEAEGKVKLYKSTQNKYEKVMIMVTETKLTPQDVNSSMAEYFGESNTLELVQNHYSIDSELEIIAPQIISKDNFVEQNRYGVLFAKSLMIGDFLFNNGETKALASTLYITIHKNKMYSIFHISELEDALGFSSNVIEKIGTPTIIEEESISNIPSTDKVNILLNGEYIYPDSDPVIVNGRTLVPIRAIAEKLGYKVEWLPNLNTVMIFDGDMNYNETIGGYSFVNSTISLAVVIGSNEIFKQAITGTETLEIDVAPMIMNDRTYLPLRAVGEALGCKVDWNGSTNTVIINSVN